MPNNKETAPVTPSQVNVAFQSVPMQDIANFSGKVTVPGVGRDTEKKLLACDIKNPCALLGQFMVHFSRPVVAVACCIFWFAYACTSGVVFDSVLCGRYWTATRLG